MPFVFSDFCLNAIGMAKYKLCIQIVKIAFLLLLVSLLMIQVIRCIFKYVEVPTYVSSKILNQNKADFPAITVCPNDNGYKADVLKYHGIQDVSSYNYKNQKNWTSNDISINESELFEKVTYRFDELVQKVYIRYFRADPVSKIYQMANEYRTGNLKKAFCIL